MRPLWLRLTSSMSQTGMFQDKWSQSGWKIEQKYANKVLLGNWAEERLKFTREAKPTCSTSRVDYQPHWDFKPDVCGRRAAVLRAEGLPSRLLFAHQGSPASRDFVTHYQVSYGCRSPTSLPRVQPRCPSSVTLKPEGSNRPVSARPTSPSLSPSTKRRSQSQQSDLPSLSVYGSAYQRLPLSAFCQTRFARTSRVLSSHLHAANHNNKDLDLKRRSLLQVPDPCLSLRHPSHSAYRFRGGAVNQ